LQQGGSTSVYSTRFSIPSMASLAFISFILQSHH
jgi:hypothetical protein